MCEPASAAPLAGLLKKRRDGHDFSRDTIVIILTGHGLKDPATALAQFPETAPMRADLDTLLALLAVPA